MAPAGSKSVNFYLLLVFSIVYLTPAYESKALDFGIEWHIPVGCGFSGFYVEFLGVSSVLADRLPELRVVSGPCSLEFYDQLFEEEARNFRTIYDPIWAHSQKLDSNLPPTLTTPVLGLLEDMDMPGGDLPRASDAYLVSSISECDTLCVERPACVGWTMRKEDNKCWLKAQQTQMVRNLGLVSKVMSHRKPLPRIDVWHGRCEVEEIKKAQQSGIYVIARLMTESSLFRNTPGVLECALAVDEVWVPTQFHYGLFHLHGVADDRLVVIPEAVDASLFTYATRKVNKMSTVEEDVIGKNLVGDNDQSSSRNANLESKNKEEEDKDKDKTFVFLSVFKWEQRKGWDVLLDAYWQAFGLEDNVVLRLRCWKPSWERGSADIDSQISTYASSKKRKVPRRKSGFGIGVNDVDVTTFREKSRYYSRSELARVEWVGSPHYPHAEELARLDMLALYTQADCFVLTTRGEGWGLPAAEAMTVGLPTIVTNFSGPTGFATSSDLAYLIPVNKLDRSGFAIIETDEVTKLLKQVYNDSFIKADTEMTIGSLARKHMMELFSPDVVGGAIVNRFEAISKNMMAKEQAKQAIDLYRVEL